LIIFVALHSTPALEARVTMRYGKQRRKSICFSARTNGGNAATSGANVVYKLAVTRCA